MWGWRIIVRAEEGRPVERNRLCNLKSQSFSNEWPSPVNDRWSRNENAAELSYEAARSGRRVLIGKQPVRQRC